MQRELVLEGESPTIGHRVSRISIPSVLVQIDILWFYQTHGHRSSDEDDAARRLQARRTPSGDLIRGTN